MDFEVVGYIPESTSTARIVWFDESESDRLDWNLIRRMRPHGSRRSLDDVLQQFEPLPLSELGSIEECTNGKCRYTCLQILIQRGSERLRELKKRHIQLIEYRTQCLNSDYRNDLRRQRQLSKTTKRTSPPTTTTTTTTTIPPIESLYELDWSIILDDESLT